MLRRIASALFLIIWIGLLSLITWLDLHNAFLIFAQHNPLLMFPTYWIVLGVLVGIPLLPLLLFWRRGLPHMLRLPVVIGVVWFLALPFIPSTTGKALLMQSNRVHTGMSIAETEAIMAGYRGGMTHADRQNGTGDLVYCTDDTCDTSVRITFDADRVVRVLIDTD
jgi:hypothetical protein